MSAQPDTAAGAAAKPGISRPKVLGVFALSMINVAAVLSLRNLPSMAEYGWASIFWIALGTILFLLPLAAVGAELATALPESTGIYDWVREAQGHEPGFIAIWAEWIENVVWFPTVMSFVSASLAYALVPSLADNKLYLFITMVSIFWLITLANCYGERWSSAISTFGVIAGTLIPAVVIIGLGVGWLVSGRASAAPIHGIRSFFPASLNISTMVLVASVVLMFAGMEMAGFHARDTKNPKRDFPRAMAISAAIIFVATVLPTIAISVVVPQAKINLVSGLVQAFSDFFQQFHVAWLTRPTSALVFIGSIALVSTWVIGQAKGMQGPTRDGLLPGIWGRENKRGVPVGVIVLQGILATLFSVAFLLVPGVNGAYWILSALTTQVLCIMYALVFTSAIRLRYTKPDLERPYRIPGGHLGIWLVAGAGAGAVAFAFILGFIPPSQITTISSGAFPIVMVIGTVVLIAPVFVFYHYRRRPIRKPAQPNPATVVAPIRLPSHERTTTRVVPAAPRARHRRGRTVARRRGHHDPAHAPPRRETPNALAHPRPHRRVRHRRRTRLGPVPEPVQQDRRLPHGNRVHPQATRPPRLQQRKRSGQPPPRRPDRRHLRARLPNVPVSRQRRERSHRLPIQLLRRPRQRSPRVHRWPRPRSRLRPPGKPLDVRPLPHHPQRPTKRHRRPTHPQRPQSNRRELTNPRRS